MCLVECLGVGFRLELVDFGDFGILGRDKLVAKVDVLLEVLALLLGALERRQKLGSRR